MWPRHRRFPRQLQTIADQGDLVHQADVDRAESVLQQLHHFGGAGAGDSDHFFNELFVVNRRHLSATCGDTPDDFGSILDSIGLVARVDAFRREGEQKIFANLPAALFQAMQCDLLRRARIGRALQHDQAACFHILGDHADRFVDESHIRLFGLPQRCGNTDADGIELGNDGRIVRRVQEAILHQRREHFIGYVLDVRPSLIDEFHLARIDIDARGSETGLGHRHAEGEADVSHTDDADVGGFISDALFECF